MLDLFDPVIEFFEWVESYSLAVHIVDVVFQLALMTIPLIKYPIYVYVAQIKSPGISEAAFYDW